MTMIKFGDKFYDGDMTVKELAEQLEKENKFMAFQKVGKNEYKMIPQKKTTALKRVEDTVGIIIEDLPTASEILKDLEDK